MRHLISILTIFTFLCGNLYSQTFDFSSQLTEPKPDSASLFYASLIDERYGITIYEPLNYRLGGDSIRHDRKGYASRGWIEDFYPNGNLLHRGYYSEGQLKIYKNYYPDGKLERSYRTLDNYRSNVEKYYKDGILKSRVLYKEGYVLKWEDYYPSGKLEYLEEFHKSLDYYIVKKSFFENGQLESLLELNPKKKVFISQEYFENGILKETGKIVFNTTMYDYQKIGKWAIFDQNGKMIKEEIYDKGVLSKEKIY